MKKRKIEVWTSKAKALLKALRFSSLPADTRSCVNNEMFFFNNRRVEAIAWAVAAIESLNVFHVLFLSGSGLGTNNNRQYFAMYLLMLASAVFCLLIKRLLRMKQRFLSCFYVGLAFFWAVWNAVLTGMDLRRNPNIMVFTTSVFALSFLLRLKPIESLCILPGSLFVLLLCARSTISSGSVINASIVTVIAVLVSCSRYFATVEETAYRQKLIIQADHSISDRQTILRLSEQQDALLAYSGELMFLWSREEQTLVFSGGRNVSEADRRTLLDWFTAREKQSADIIDLYMGTEQEQPGTYLIEITPQYDCEEALTGAVGRLTPWEKAIEG